jgi:hypothetical protein
MTIQREHLPAIRDDINAALAAVAAKHGLTLHLGSISFDANSFTGKLHGAVAGFDPRRRDWQQLAALADLDPTWLDATVQYAKRTFVIAGMDSGRAGFKVCLKDPVTGKEFTAKATDFKRGATLVRPAPTTVAA